MLQKLVLAATTMLLPLLLQAQQDTKTTQNSPQTEIDYKQTGAPMPPLKYMAYNDTTATAKAARALRNKKAGKHKNSQSDTDAMYTFMTEKDFEIDGNLFVMMFNPTCSHCEDVTFMLEKNIDLFKKDKVVMLANKVMEPYLPDFTQRHHIDSYPAIYIGYDSSGFIGNAYMYQALPQINIYSPDHILLKSYSGEVPMDTLKKYINTGHSKKKRKKKG
jgi:hypothetical protein